MKTAFRHHLLRRECSFLKLFEGKKNPNWVTTCISDLIKTTDPVGASAFSAVSMKSSRRLCNTFSRFRVMARSSTGFKSAFKVVSERDTESILSLVATKVPERSWTTPGRVLGNLAYIGSMVTLHLMKNRTEQNLFRRLRYYEFSLISDQIRQQLTCNQ